MGVELVIVAEAAADLTDAFDWYEVHRSGLGDEFLARTDDCIQTIMQHPEAFPIIYESYRRAILRRFPYAIYYEYDRDVVTVYGVFHAARDPQKWRRRLE